MNLRKRTAELLEQGHYDDRPSRILNLLLIAMISLNVVAIMLESVDAIHAEYHRHFWYFDVFSVAVFTVEYLARVWSAVDLAEIHDSRPVIGRLKYMLTPLALVDLVAILPFYLSLYVSFDLRFLRVVRLLRLFKLTRYSPALGALLDVIRQESEALLSSIVILLLMLVIASGGIYLLEHELQPEAFGSIPSSMWWAMVTLTTLGYGDVVPITPMGKVFGGMIGLIGIGMIALPAAIMASGFAENVHNRKHRYNTFAERMLEDGVIDDEERWELEKLRKELGLDRAQAMRLLDAVLRRARAQGAARGHCPHCGKVQDHAREDA